MTHGFSGAAPMLLLALLAAACGGSDAGGSTHVQVDTLPGGAVRVVDDGTGQWTPATAWRLEEDLRLGRREGEAPDLFSGIEDLLVDSAGRLFVLDNVSQEIRVFGPSGDFLYRFGGKGQGPGELQYAAGLSWAPDGRLWVWGGAGYSVFEPSGTYVTRYARSIRNVHYPFSGGFGPGGRFIDWGGVIDQEVVQENGHLVAHTSGRVTMLPIAFTPPDRLDTLAGVTYQAEVTDEQVMKRGHSGMNLALSRDGHLWFAHTNDYTVYERTLDGDTLLAFGLSGRTPMAVPTAEMDSAIALNVQRGGPHLDRDSFVPYRPLVTGIVPDDHGHVWVFPQEHGVPEGTVADVFETSGTYLGRVAIPDAIDVGSVPPVITGDHVYAVVRDAMEVPYVVRYRIVGAEGEGDSQGAMDASRR